MLSIASGNSMAANTTSNLQVSADLEKVCSIATRDIHIDMAPNQTTASKMQDMDILCSKNTSFILYFQPEGEDEYPGPPITRYMSGMPGNTDKLKFRLEFDDYTGYIEDVGTGSVQQKTLIFSIDSEGRLVKADRYSASVTMVISY